MQGVPWNAGLGLLRVRKMTLRKCHLSQDWKHVLAGDGLVGEALGDNVSGTGNSMGKGLEARQRVAYCRH